MNMKPRHLLANPTTNSTKFNLFLKTHEIREIHKVLRHVMLLPPDQRVDWIEENGEIVQSAFDSFIDDSNLVLDDISIDDETIELSHQLITSLKSALSIVENILSENQILQS